MTSPSTALLIWTLYFIGLLAILKFVFKYSFVETLQKILAEFIAISSASWNKQSLNAIGTIGSFAFLLLVAFNGTLEKFFYGKRWRRE